MSGDTTCDLEALVFCPFCGSKTQKVEVYWELYENENGEQSTIPDNTHTQFKYIQFRIECESKQNNFSVCCAMEETGAYFLNVYPNGDCYAQYF